MKDIVNYTQDSIHFSEAVEQFLFAKRAQRLSPNTIRDYERTYRYFQNNLSTDQPIDEIKPIDVRRFMASLELSKKSLLNIHVGLSSLWSWMVREEIIPENIMKKVERPRPEIRAITPFTKGEVDTLFLSLERSNEYSRPGKRACSHRLQNYYRNRAILLIFLDTGMRSSEVCGLRFTDFISQLRIRVFGKGGKERLLPISEITAKAIDDYVQKERPSAKSCAENIFVTRTNKKLCAYDLYHRISIIGTRAGIHSNPHRFRHTFAINFLRNGGDIYALQAMLGHTSFEMVKRYLAIARADIEAAHQKASPVINWGLGK